MSTNTPTPDPSSEPEGRTPSDPASEQSEQLASNSPRAFGAAKALSVLVPVAVIAVIADQLTKIWAERNLTLGAQPIEFLGTLVQLRLIYNPGAALSMGSGMTWVLTLISLAVVVFIAVMAKKLASQMWVVTLGLLLGGALGNLIDRLFRDPGFPQGHVVDFLDYGIFIGNVADIAIVGAAIMIAVLSLIGVAPFAQEPVEPVQEKA